ncbi:hypothetical protein [Streptomyces malaysiensis]|uniref:hypothetical protein n=1 Tax=Streptomyces malaysiensis TaxID=92644 RepID=UPI00371F03EE
MFAVFAFPPLAEQLPEPGVVCQVMAGGFEEDALCCGALIVGGEETGLVADRLRSFRDSSLPTCAAIISNAAMMRPEKVSGGVAGVVEQHGIS